MTTNGGGVKPAHVQPFNPTSYNIRPASSSNHGPHFFCLNPQYQQQTGNSLGRSTPTSNNSRLSFSSSSSFVVYNYFDEATLSDSRALPLNERGLLKR